MNFFGLSDMTLFSRKSSQQPKITLKLKYPSTFWTMICDRENKIRHNINRVRKKILLISELNK